MHMYPLFFRFYSHIGHYRVLSSISCAIQQILQLSVLYKVVCICQSQSPSLSLPPLSPLVTVSSFSVSVHLFLFSHALKFFLDYFWLPWVFVAAQVLSLVVASKGYTLLGCVGFSLQWLLLLQSMGPSMWAQQSWHTSLFTPRHGGSS